MLDYYHGFPRYNIPMRSPRKNSLDLTGETFGRLVVLGEAERRGRARYWVCRCCCGNVVEVAQTNLRQKRTRSCGCLHRERMVALHSTHGMSYRPEYKLWVSMKARCDNPNNKQYPKYGARGVNVCDRWKQSFAAFLEDMGPQPSPAHIIDRIDDDTGYQPDNCRWTMADEQSRKRRTARFITFDGQTRTVQDWACALGMSPNALHARLGRLGWSIERALSTPVRARA